MRRSAAFAVWMLAFAGCLRAVEPEHFVCNSNADCASDERCPAAGPNANTCHPANQCGSALDCGRGEICFASTCFVPECLVDSTCSPYRCDNNGTCAKFCQSDNDCASSFSCISGSCSTDPCFNGVFHCGTYRCSHGACQTSCSYDADCASSYVCRSAKCVAPVSMDAGAVDAAQDAGQDAGKDAGQGTKLSGEACKSASECAAGQCCPPRAIGSYSNYCAATCEGKNPVGVRCLGDSECISGTTCADFDACTKPCKTHADCGVNVLDSQLTPNYCDGSLCYPGCWGSQTTCIPFTNPTTGAALVCRKLSGASTPVCVP